MKTLPFFVTPEMLKFTPASYYERYVTILETPTKGVYVFTPKSLFVIIGKKGDTRASIPLSELSDELLNKVLESENINSSGDELELILKQIVAYKTNLGI